MVEPKRHSKLGILSCLIAGAVWVYFVVAVYLFFFVDGFTKKVTDFLVPPSNTIADLRGIGMALMVFAVVFLVIPGAGHLIGIVMAFIGLIRSNNKKLFPIVGLLLNALPIAILLTLYVIGTLTPTN